MIKRSFFVALVLALFEAAVLVSPALAINQQGICNLQGGTWSGPDGDNGTCTYPPGNAEFVANCQDSNNAYIEEFAAGVQVNAYCTTATVLQRPTSTEGEQGSATLQLGGGKNGSVTFPPGSCPQQCTISANLPNGANSDLPGDQLATLYVRVVDEGGGPGSGSYTACFDNPDGATLTIYRYIGSVWTAVRSASTNPICVTASGDGAFYLGG